MKRILNPETIDNTIPLNFFIILLIFVDYFILLINDVLFLRSPLSKNSATALEIYIN